MNPKTLAAVALGLSLVVSQVSAQQTVAAPGKARAVNSGVTKGVQRATAPKGRVNKQTSLSGMTKTELLLFAGTGLVAGAMIIDSVNNDEKPKSP